MSLPPVRIEASFLIIILMRESVHYVVVVEVRGILSCSDEALIKHFSGLALCYVLQALARYVFVMFLFTLTQLSRPSAILASPNCFICVLVLECAAF